MSEKRLIKFLLSGSTCVYMYLSDESFEKLQNNEKFIKSSDDNNEDIFISMKHICGYEVVKQLPKDEDAKPEKETL